MDKEICTSAIYWFRKGLRLHDNPALQHALDNSTKVFPIFILDPKIRKFLNVGPNRWRFLMQTLNDLDARLRATNKSRLLVIRGDPVKVFPILFKSWNVKLLTFESDTEPYAKLRDEEVSKLAKSLNVKVVTKVLHTLYDVKDIIAQTYPKGVPLTYQAFQGVIGKMGLPPKPLDQTNFSSTQAIDRLDYQIDDWNYDVPNLEELGVDEDKDCGPCLYVGGETEALKRLKKYMQNNDPWVWSFSKPDTSPNSIQPSTTVLSPYLKFGCLSPRKFYYELKAVLDRNRVKCTKPPVSLEGQLLWREFFYAVGATTSNFGKMEGNPICRQIPWSSDPELLEAWKYGRTGFPFIDSIMIQLRTEGWIHHLARHAVACFLTRGDLWQSWEEGVKVFEEYLLDADWSLNAANWMWLSASGFFHQYFRVYSPIAFGKKTDPDGLYIRKYIPALKNFPKAYIYEPWKASLTVQHSCKCIIGKDYPKPIVDHDTVRDRNLQRMKEAYKKPIGKT